jgi:hypothetical protein
MRMVRACACLALILGLAGCADRSSIQDDNDKLCDELAQMDGTVTRLAALDPNTVTVQQVRDLKAQIDREYRDVQEAAKEAAPPRMDLVTSAYDNLSRSVATVNSREAFTSALPGINQAAGELSEARVEVNTTGGC